MMDSFQMYKNYGEVEIFDPRIELKKAKNSIEAYLKRRAKAAWVSLFFLSEIFHSNIWHQ